MLPFRDGDVRKDTKIYPGSGKRRPYVQPGGGENLYYLAPKCLYEGEYKGGVEMEYGFLFYVCLMFRCVSAPGPPLL